jgi:hypothetical protein
MDLTLLFSTHLQELLTMKPKIKAIVTAAILSSSLLANASVHAQQSFSGEAAWRRLSELAEQAWDRGDPVAACRQSIHAAHLMNNTRSKGWGELEQTYWKTVVRFCKEAIQ